MFRGKFWWVNAWKCKEECKTTGYKQLYRTKEASCPLNLYICVGNTNNWYTLDKGRDDGKPIKATALQIKAFKTNLDTMFKVK